MWLIDKAIKHLKENQMTYREHLVFAVGHGILSLVAGLMLIVHGILPCFFEHTGSNLVRRLKISFDQHKKKDNH